MPLILGGIVMWSGAVENIPEGWALCNGQNETIDLRNRFVVGAGDLYAVGVTGGSADATLVSHNHTGQSISTTTNHTHTFEGRASQQNGQPPRFLSVQQFNLTTTTSSAGSHSHTASIGTTGVSATNANLPPYYALAFIQQIS